jgi:hypothetical protein
MKNRIINFIRGFIVIVLTMAVLLALGYVHEQNSINEQEYSMDHECVEFMSYLEEDEFGDQYLKEIYRYSDGHIVENHDYLRVGF